MTIQELVTAVNYAYEQINWAEKRLDMTSLGEPELIDAAIFEQKAWELRYKFYKRKLKEAMQSGQAIPCQRHLQLGGRR